MVVGFGERHTDTVIGNRQRLSCRIGLDMNRKIRIVFNKVGIRERQKMQFFNRIGSIGD